MNQQDETVIRRAYAESSQAARDMGISGHLGEKVVVAAAARVASRFLGRPITPEDVRTVMAGPIGGTAEE